MMRYPFLLSAVVLVCVFGPWAPVALAADPAPPAKATAGENLTGLTRNEVIALRGKPTGERASGDRLVMVYPDGAKVELRGGVVVSVSGVANAAEIVSADGTRYEPGADGNIKRPVEVIEPGTESAAPASARATEGSSVDSKPTDAAAASEAAGEHVKPGEDLPPGAIVPSALDPDSIEPDEEGAEFEGEDDAPAQSPAIRIVGFVFGTLVRFALTVLVLRIAVQVVGVPFFWPDLLKVALLNLAVQGTLSGLGELGGWWEFIPLFRLDTVIGFIVLACSLTWFKIAASGLTALKIAAATGAVIYGLMLAVGLALAFALPALLK